MRVGVTLPQFRDYAEPALAVARRAEDIGLDGVFVFDHLWPLHQPERPALHSLTLLGALAAETERVVLGTYVARVSLLPNAVLVHALMSLHRMLGPRFIAGLGTGDRDNRDENIAYGVGFPPADVRALGLETCCRELSAAGVRTWVGGNSSLARRIAAADADGWNGWGMDLDAFRAAAAELRAGAGATTELSWGGQVLIGRTPDEAAAKLERHGPRPGLVHGTVDDLRRHFDGLAEAGAAWAICSPVDVGTDEGAVEVLAQAQSE
jgi:alkanesulfonate monooxygenase SsuD/methylene tetrahydromethanopterin reductase-like flavin-dependent oxidoreductase (luciferase family)